MIKDIRQRGHEKKRKSGLVRGRGKAGKGGGGGRDGKKKKKIFFFFFFFFFGCPPPPPCLPANLNYS